MNLSEFGKYMRLLRMERNELLLDTAQKLNVTSSYLSAVEKGKRNVPEAWVGMIIKCYNLNAEEQVAFRRAVFNSIQTFEIDSSNSAAKREVLMSLKNDEIDEETMRSLVELINNSKRD